MANVSVTSEWMTTYAGEAFTGVEQAWCLDHPEGPIIVYADSTQGVSDHLAIYRSADRVVRHWRRYDGVGYQVRHISARLGVGGTINIGVAFNEGSDHRYEVLWGLDPRKLDDADHWNKKAVLNVNISPVDRVTLTDCDPDRVAFIQHDEKTGWMTGAQINAQGQLYRTFPIWVASIPSHANMFSPDRDTKVRALPANVQMGAQPGNTYGNGFYFQYTTGGQSYVQYRSDSGLSVTRAIPGTIQSMKTVIAWTDNRTDLLLGTDRGLLLLKSTCFSLIAPRDPILLHPGNVSHVRISSSAYADVQTFWMILSGTGGQQSQLGYVVYDGYKVGTGTHSADTFIPIMSGDFNQISPSMDEAGDLQRILYCDSAGKPFLLEQSSLGIWSSIPLTLSLTTHGELQEETAFVTHIKYTTVNRGEEANRQVGLWCSSSASVRVNGKLVTVDSSNPKGTIVTTDAKGSIEIVNTAPGLATPRFKLVNVDHDPLPALPTYAGGHLDPAHTVIQKLKTLTSVGDLKALNIFKTNTDEALKPVWDVVRDLRDHMNTLPSSGLPKSPTTAAKPTHGWEFWRQVQRLGNEIKTFVLKEEMLTVKWAQQEWKFLVSTFEQALQGLETIFKVAGAEMDKLQKWLGYVFNWTNIMDCQKSLKAVVETMASCGPELMDLGIAHMNDALDDLKGLATSTDQTVTKLPEDVKQKKNLSTDLKTEKDNAASSGKTPPNTSHSAVDYILNRLQLIWSGTPKPVQSLSGIDSDLWLKTIPNLLKSIERDLAKIKKDIADVFNNKGTKSVKELLSSLGSDVLITIIDVLKAVLDAMAESLKAVLTSLGARLEQSISVPFFSGLYRHANDSTTDPSILDIAMFILAIPTAILSTMFEVDTPVITYDDLHSKLFVSSNVRRDNSGGHKKQSRAELWDWYHNKLYPGFLEPVKSYISFVSCVSYSILLIPDYAENVLDEDTYEKVAPWVGNVGEVIFSILKIVLQASYIPVMDKWEPKYSPGTRFSFFGADCIWTFFDVYFSLSQKTLGMSIEDKDKLQISSFKVAGGFMALIWVVLISADEVQYSDDTTWIPPWSNAQRVNAKKIAGWTIVEALFFAANRIGSPLCEYIKDPEAKAIAATGVFASGLVAGSSLLARVTWTSSLGIDEPPGPTTNP